VDLDRLAEQLGPEPQELGLGQVLDLGPQRRDRAASSWANRPRMTAGSRPCSRVVVTVRPAGGRLAILGGGVGLLEPLDPVPRTCKRR
jgi:hypothetical protein